MYSKCITFIWLVTVMFSNFWQLPRSARYVRVAFNSEYCIQWLIHVVIYKYIIEKNACVLCTWKTQEKLSLCPQILLFLLYMYMLVIVQITFFLPYHLPSFVVWRLLNGSTCSLHSSYSKAMFSLSNHFKTRCVFEGGMYSLADMWRNCAFYDKAWNSTHI